MQYICRDRERKQARALAPAEHPGNHGSTNISGKGTRIEASLQDSTGLTELVASREGKGVGDREHKSDGCGSISMDSSINRSTMPTYRPASAR